MKKHGFLYLGLLFVLGSCGLGQSQDVAASKEFESLRLPQVIEVGMRDRSQYEAKSKDYMISTQGPGATEAAAKVFEAGGNAIDAAVAASFMISVERPQSTGLGGGGFMLIRFAETGEILAVDFREKAPMLATANMYLDQTGEVIRDKSKKGIFAAGVPGLVAGLSEVHRRFGRVEWNQLVEPSIQLAKNGLKVYPHLANALDKTQDTLKKYPASAAIFLKEDGSPYEVGDILFQNDLAETLKLIQENNRAGFYKGSVANAIVAENQRLGGLMAHADLDAYNVIFREPVVGQFKGFDIYSMPPPSSGGAHIIQILNMLENDPLKELGAASPFTIHLTSQAMQSAFADRASYMGDADFVEVPLSGIISKNYAKRLRSKFSKNKARPSDKVKAGEPSRYESDETTHFTIMDSQGNIVTTTQTINGWMGSGVVVPGTGIVLNNEMDDFTTKVGAANFFGAIGGEPNRIEAQKRPLSSMSPTIVMKDDEPVMALGTASGTRILTCVAQTILNHLYYGMPLYEAVSVVRYHHQWQPDKIRVDVPGFPAAVKKQLIAMDYEVEEKDLGCKMQVVKKEATELHGVSDPRGQGKSFGR